MTKYRSAFARCWVLLAVFSAIPAMAAVSGEPVPVWQVTYTRVFPGKMDQYLEQVRKLLIPILEEDKRAGALLDYKVIRKLNRNGADDWNLEIAIMFRNHAQLDNHMDRWDAIEKKLNVGKPPVQYPDRDTLRVDVGTDFFEEIRSN